MAIKKAEVVKTVQKPILFTKEQILKSRKYTHNKDLVSVLLLDSNLYSLEEVDRKIEKFMKGKVE